MKHTALFLAISLSLVASGAQAAEYGLGIALINQGEIFLPINVRDDLRFEPSVAVQVFKTTDAFNNTQEQRTIFLKAGLFSIRPVSEGLNLLFGGRLGYLKQNASNVSPGFSQTDKLAEFTIEPTLGVEYYPIKHIALGAEAALIYRQVKIDSGSSATDQKGLDTTTKITVKYFY